MLKQKKKKNRLLKNRRGFCFETLVEKDCTPMDSNFQKLFLFSSCALSREDSKVLNWNTRSKTSYVKNECAQDISMGTNALDILA